MTYQVHLVEDEPNLNRLLTSYLQKEGWKVFSFHAGGVAFYVEIATVNYNPGGCT